VIVRGAMSGGEVNGGFRLLVTSTES
jgi:hypothetical protein